MNTTQCFWSIPISNYGIHVINEDCEYEDTKNGVTYFNSEQRTIEDDIQWLRKIFDIWEVELEEKEYED